jgi:hypothetical protein
MTSRRARRCVQCDRTRSNIVPMFSKCPACGSLNVRRSSLRPSELSRRPRFRSPYRCRDCGDRFWVVSRRVNYVGGTVGVVLIAGAIAWNVRSAPEVSGPTQEQRPADEAALSATMKRAQHNDPAAEFQLYQMYAGGQGLEPGKKEAWNWLERAARDGYGQAQYELGNAFREGTGVVQDYETAAKWLQLAATNGHADAQYALAEMYYRGTGVEADNVKAYLWFNLAAAQDVPGAAIKRDALLRSLSPAEVREAQAEARRLSQAMAQRSDQQH